LWQIKNIAIKYYRNKIHATDKNGIINKTEINKYFLSVAFYINLNLSAKKSKKAFTYKDLIGILY